MDDQNRNVVTPDWPHVAGAFEHADQGQDEVIITSMRWSGVKAGNYFHVCYKLVTVPTLVQCEGRVEVGPGASWDSIKSAIAADISSNGFKDVEVAAFVTRRVGKGVIGQCLRANREAMHVTVARLAKHFGLHERSVTLWETERVNPTPAHLTKLVAEGYL